MFGLKLLIGSSTKSVKKSGTIKGSYYMSNRSGEYTIVFSSGTIDLRDLQENVGDMEITVVFGRATVILPTHLNFDIEPTSVFGSCQIKVIMDLAGADINKEILPEDQYISNQPLCSVSWNMSLRMCPKT
jgi:hypothetical protein